MKHALAAVLLVCSQPLLAQEPAADASFSLRQQVHNVVVDVVVIDKHGQPVTDLDRAAFEVMENGAPQQIAFFEHHIPGASSAGTAAMAPALAVNVHTNAAPQMPNGSLMVLLLDAMNTPAAQQSYVHAQALEYLKAIPANTRMAIFVLGNELRMIQNFTSDPALLRMALDNHAYPTHAASTGTELINADHVSQVNSAMASAPVGSGSLQSGQASAATSIRSSLERFSNTGDLGQEMRLRYTLDTLNALSMYLGGIPGRKSLIWFSSSIPWTINPDFSLVSSVIGRADYSEDLKRLADRMTEARISVYPIDAHALGTPGNYDPSAGGNIVGAGSTLGGGSVHGAATTGSFAASDMAEQMDMAGAHQSMQNLASATGGRAIFNTNGLAEAIEHVNSIGQNYYTLVYAPTDKREDGSFRRIEVRLARQGLKLEFRRGYYAEDPTKAAQHDQLVLSNPLRVLMQHGAPDATQVLFRIQHSLAKSQPDPARPETRAGTQAGSLTGPLTRYEFHWNVDLGTVVFRNGGGQHQGQLDAALTAYDAQGKIVNSIHSTLPLNLSEEQFAKFRASGLPMKQALDLPQGIVSMRVAVVDQTSGRTGATEFPLVVSLPN